MLMIQVKGLNLVIMPSPTKIPKGMEIIMVQKKIDNVIPVPEISEGKISLT
ncbi:hypothetical protein FD25_GL001085 [Levilactobacillus acidifarinae DSM 19394]|uniref:Uncharacterized protein n=1 Tax=Levilactobacillus acidifarinae DSM 19394 = JCM 15949 TaxID=1423715 RepID=A0A0R1LDA7_9LACO|nr:hypothetical protein FD25_GL001085 [Levilactobacillus acidifarinae DSM 19394]